MSAYVPVSIENSSKLRDLIAEGGNWTISIDSECTKIDGNFKFKDFIEAFAFMTKIAIKSEKLDHHPNWSNVYNTVKISWYTHEIGGLSEHDIKMAEFCNSIY